MSKESNIQRDLIEYIILGIGLLLTSFLSAYSYLLFHSIAEVISIVISGGIFFIGWNSRKYMKSSFFLIIGISFLFISVIDLLHTLSYSGMGILIEFNANLPTELWIAARYWQSLSYLISSIAINKKIRAGYVMFIGLVILSVLLLTIFYGIFPTSYIEGIGLTPFKVISEYIINLIFLASAIIIYKFRSEFQRKIFILIMISISATIISELAFTFYVSVFDFSNFIGHIFKIIAFFFIYKAIIETGLEDPFGLLLRKLKLSDDSLRRKADDLERAYSEFNQMFNASAPLRIINKDCEVIRVNKTYTALFNLSREEIIGKKCYDTDLKHLGHQCNTELCSMKQIEEGKDYFEYELTTNLDENTKIVTLVSSVPYRNIKGEFVGIIQNFTNIT
ncbi:MAG: MASE3 domain-containing protein, partial [Candidatus Hermodarchaeota archaeon]